VTELERASILQEKGKMGFLDFNINIKFFKNYEHKTPFHMWVCVFRKKKVGYLREV
jgi:hypothetical protein